MKAIITFQGFTESEEKATGTEDLFFHVIREFSSPTITTYHPRQWTAEITPLIKQLCRQGIYRVAIVSYSHGQAAACDFARRAEDYGIVVQLWLACDPVFRPTWLPRWNILQPLAVRAMLKKATIEVPRNIRKVIWCRQNLTRPNGHELKAESGNTIILPPTIYPYAHTAIDSAPEWRSVVQNHLTQWTQK